MKISKLVFSSGPIWCSSEQENVRITVPTSTVWWDQKSWLGRVWVVGLCSPMRLGLIHTLELTIGNVTRAWGVVCRMGWGGRRGAISNIWMVISWEKSKKPWAKFKELSCIFLNLKLFPIIGWKKSILQFFCHDDLQEYIISSDILPCNKVLFKTAPQYIEEKNYILKPISKYIFILI